MPRLLYACRFELPEASGAEAIVSTYREWIAEHYSRRYQATGIEFNFESNVDLTEHLRPGHSLQITHYSVEAGKVCTIRWEIPSETDGTLKWENVARIGVFENRISVEHTISTTSLEFLITPVRVEMGSPRVIRKICAEQIVFVGDMQIRANPYSMSLGEISQLTTLLESPLRRLPVVLLSPYTNGDRNSISSAAIASALAGIAVVVEPTTPDVTWALTDAVGRSLSCFDGAARIYWAGFSKADEPRVHPLYFAPETSAIRSISSARLIQRAIFSVAAFRFVSDHKINAVIRDAETLQRSERLKEKQADAGADWEKYALELDEQLQTAKYKISDLEAENENLKTNQKVLFTGGVADEVEIEPEAKERSPETNREAVEFAREEFPNLVVLESALEAAEDSPFRRPIEFYETLAELNRIAREWNSRRASTGTGGDLRQHIIESGYGKRCSMSISDTTRRKYKSDYTFNYDGKPTLFEPHITLGSGDANSCGSIHFLPDHEKGKIVIAHVGRHLRNTKT